MYVSFIFQSYYRPNLAEEKEMKENRELKVETREAEKEAAGKRWWRRRRRRRRRREMTLSKSKFHEVSSILFSDAERRVELQIKFH